MLEMQRVMGIGVGSNENTLVPRPSRRQSDASTLTSTTPAQRTTAKTHRRGIWVDKVEKGGPSCLSLKTVRFVGYQLRQD
jgi:hypothetical protein